MSHTKMASFAGRFWGLLRTLQNLLQRVTFARTIAAKIAQRVHVPVCACVHVYVCVHVHRHMCMCLSIFVFRAVTMVVQGRQRRVTPGNWSKSNPSSDKTVGKNTLSTDKGRQVPRQECSFSCPPTTPPLVLTRCLASSRTVGKPVQRVQKPMDLRHSNRPPQKA